MAGKLTPRERRHQRTKKAILDAARTIVNEAGPDALSIREIAKRIDYSPAGLYEYFGSKEEIIAAVCREGHARLYCTMAAVPVALPPLDYLLEIGLKYIKFAREHPDYFLLMFTTVTTPDTAAVEMMAQDSAFALLVAGAERAVNHGSLAITAKRGLMDIVYSLWAIVHGLACLQVSYLSKFEFPVDFAAADPLVLRAHIAGLQQIVE